MKLRLLLGLTLLLAACAGPTDDQIPGYLRLEPPVVEVPVTGETLRVEGASRELWLFQGGQYVGTFQPPATVPLLDRSRTQLLARMGVWNVQNPAERVMYPFWQFDTLDHAFSAEEEIVWRPRARYFDDSTLTYPFIENFEGSDIGLVYGETSRQDTAYLTRQTDGPYEGRSFGRVHFGDSARVFYMFSAGSFRLPARQVWAEVTYRGNRKFGLGLLASTSTEDALIPAPPGYVPALPPQREGWQTIYFNLTSITTAVSATATYRLYLNSISDGSDFELDFDHIRLVHFR